MTSSWFFIRQLCSACFAIRAVKLYVSQQMLKMIYYSYFHSIMSCGIMFWGHFASSIRAFRSQKRIIRIMMGCRSRNSCRKLFIRLKILTLPSLYILSLLLVVIKNKELFTTNNEIHLHKVHKELFTTDNEIHSICTRQHLNFHQPSANLTKYQTGMYYMGLKIFNTLSVCTV